MRWLQGRKEGGLILEIFIEKILISNAIMSISKAEITNVSEHGFWICFSDTEYFLPYDEFPWFRECKLSTLFNFETSENGHFYWPDLDVDLSIEIIENPEKFPLKFD